VKQETGGTPIQTAPTPQSARGSQRSIRRFPASYGLIGLTSLVFLLQNISIQITHYDWFLLFGAKVNGAIAAGQIWRLITPIFLHAGLWHVGVNMYSLYALGPAIERFFGSIRMAVIYLLSGISGVIFSLAFSPAASVGASGAIFGLLGALASFLYRHRQTFGAAGRFHLRQILLIAVINLGIGLMPQIDNWGHLGGLLGGVLLTWFIGPRFEVHFSLAGQPVLKDHRPWPKARRYALLGLMLLGVLAYLAILNH